MITNIRKINFKNESERQGLEELQYNGWGLSGEDVVSSDVMEIISSQGLILGAFSKGDKTSYESMNGFLLGFDTNTSELIKKLEGRHVPYHLMTELVKFRESDSNQFDSLHYSHMMAINNPLRGNGIGEKLKLQQKEIVLDGGIKTIMFTYDPLLSRNANLNVRKLGGRVFSDGYEEDLYKKVSGVYSGVPSDRFWLTWKLDSPVKKIRSYNDFISEGAIICNETEKSTFSHEGESFGYRVLLNFPLNLAVLESPLLYEIPEHFNEPNFINSSENQSQKLRQKMRLQSRGDLRNLFKEGYQVIDFVRTKSDQESRSFYVLKKEDQK